MESEIQNATSIHEINSVLESWAGRYDLDMVILAKAGIGISAKKGIIETPIVGGRGSSIEFTGRDVYSVESTKNIDEVKNVIIKSIRHRQ